MFRLKQIFQFLLCHEAAGENDVIDGTTAGQGLPGDGRGGFIAEAGIEGRHDADGVAHHVLAAFAVGGDVADAEIDQRAAARAQTVNARKQRVGNDGLHDIEFQLPCFGRQRDGNVLADDVEADLIHDFRHDGIHLAGHDGGARLPGRQVYFIEPAARPGGQQAQVVANLDIFVAQRFRTPESCT